MWNDIANISAIATLLFICILFSWTIVTHILQKSLFKHALGILHLYIGFTEAEVKALTEKYNQDYEKKITEELTMGHFYFIRHGQTVWNVENKICGATDSPLTEYGREQAKETGQKILTEGLRQMKSSALRLAGQRILPG